MVQTSLSSVHILDVAPYNHFTVTCTARAELNGGVVPYNMTIDWKKRKQPHSGTKDETTLEVVNSAQYETTVLPDHGYQSILTTTETDTQNMIRYRCIAQLKDGGNDVIITRQATTDVEVQGMCPIVCVIDPYTYFHNY